MLDRPDFRWTDENVERLRACIVNGFTAAQASSALGEGYRMPPTRSSVLGKAHRLGLAFGVGGDRIAHRQQERAGRRGFPWSNPATIAKFRELVAKGYSSREIIARMAQSFHAAPPLSVTAVQQRASILGVSIRKPAPSKPKSPNPAPGPQAIGAQDSGREVTHTLPPANIIGVTLLDLQRDSCRFPLGDPLDDDFRFCGAVAKEGRPYCGAHFLLSIDKAAVDRRRRKTSEGERHQRQSLDRPRGPMAFAFGGADA